MRRLSAIIPIFTTLALISSSLPVSAASYKIKQGDTLWTIAARNHTTVAELTKANHINEKSVLSLGKALTIPGKTDVKKSSRTTTPVQQISYAIHTNASSVCLRSAAGTNSSKITTLSSGTTLKLLARNGKWAKVALPNGKCGYVHRSLLAKGAGSEGPDRQAISPGDRDGNGALIQTALACRGVSYQRGGTSRGGFDCSGFTRFVYARHGISLPHSSSAQAGRGTSVSRDQLKSGDLVFFQTNRRGISHVGIYIGNGNFVHAASRGRGVTVDSLDSSYYAPRYRGARRVN